MCCVDQGDNISIVRVGICSNTLPLMGTLVAFAGTQSASFLRAEDLSHSRDVYLLLKRSAFTRGGCLALKRLESFSIFRGGHLKTSPNLLYQPLPLPFLNKGFPYYVEGQLPHITCFSVLLCSWAHSRIKCLVSCCSVMCAFTPHRARSCYSTPTLYEVFRTLSQTHSMPEESSWPLQISLLFVCAHVCHAILLLWHTMSALC